jgi:hypothetical protein
MKKIITENEIKRIIRNTLLEIFNNEIGPFETEEKTNKNNKDNDISKETRDSIEAFFKQPGVNNAPYAYNLYGVDAKEGEDTNEMKNARKKFADCLNHAKNDAGYEYSFSSEQLNHLANTISTNNSIN